MTENLPQAEAGTEPIARCGSHPLEAAVGTCTRCGGFVCRRCLEDHGAASLCAACHARLRSTLRASPRARWALALGIVGLNTGFVLGLLALYLARQELAAVRRGVAPPAGEAVAIGARWLGTVNALLLGAATLYGLSQWLG